MGDASGYFYWKLSIAVPIHIAMYQLWDGNDGLAIGSTRWRRGNHPLICLIAGLYTGVVAQQRRVGSSDRVATPVREESVVEITGWEFTSGWGAHCRSWIGRNAPGRNGSW